MLDLSPSSRLRPKQQGFTLIELLMVFAVILILAGITFGISRGVQNAQARAKAKAELATISQALETYKSKHGDYPWVSLKSVASDDDVNNSSHGLMKTLVGWQAVDESQVGDTMNYNGQVFNGAKSVLDVSKLSLSVSWPATDPEQSPSLGTRLIDPWGNAYVYIYKDSEDSTKWERFGYILLSRGPDGKASSSGIDEGKGELSTFRDEEDNIDNIFAGE